MFKKFLYSLFWIKYTIFNQIFMFLCLLLLDFDWKMIGIISLCTINNIIFSVITYKGQHSVSASTVDTLVCITTSVVLNIALVHTIILLEI